MRVVSKMNFPFTIRGMRFEPGVVVEFNPAGLPASKLDVILMRTIPTAVDMPTTHAYNAPGPVTPAAPIGPTPTNASRGADGGSGAGAAVGGAADGVVSGGKDETAGNVSTTGALQAEASGHRGGGRPVRGPRGAAKG